MFKNGLPFPNNNRLPQRYSEDFFQVCHLPKSTRKKFLERIQQTFKRNHMFRNEIKKALADLYKKHADSVRNRTCDENFDKRKTDLLAQACTAKTLDIARDNIKTIKTVNENVVTYNKQHLYCICNKPDDALCMFFVKLVINGFIQNAYSKKDI